jgi:hypothetical protein
MFYDNKKMFLDRNAAIISLRKFRSETKHKTEKELTAFTEKQFLNCVIGQVSDRLEMKYTLDSHEVCRDTYCFAYCLTTFQMKKISRLYKESADRTVNSAKISKWGDDHVHLFTLAESRDIFMNLVAEPAGTSIEAGN